jgi:uncharacterized membrane protein
MAVSLMLELSSLYGFGMAVSLMLELSSLYGFGMTVSLMLELSSLYGFGMTVSLMLELSSHKSALLQAAHLQIKVKVDEPERQTALPDPER